MSKTAIESENERSSQQNLQKRIEFPSHAEKNDAGPSRIRIAEAVREIACAPQSSSDSEQKIPAGREARKKRQQRYREKHRKAIRERNKKYYSNKHKHTNDDDVVINKEDNRKRLQNERSRRYREKNREAIKQRNERYRQHQKNVEPQSQVQQEIFDVEKNLELMRKAIADKSYALRVAHTRLEARMHRPELELCRDYAHVSLQKEIEDINRQVEKMHKMLKEVENQHQRLLRTRNALEHDLALKIDAMYIDKEKVGGLRRAYPVNALFRF